MHVCMQVAEARYIYCFYFIFFTASYVDREGKREGDKERGVRGAAWGDSVCFRPVFISLTLMLACLLARMYAMIGM